MVPIEAIRLVFSSIASTAVVAGPLLESERTKMAMLRSILKLKADTGSSSLLDSHAERKPFDEKSQAQSFGQVLRVSKSPDAETWT